MSRPLETAACRPSRIPVSRCRTTLAPLPVSGSGDGRGGRGPEISIIGANQRPGLARHLPGPDVNGLVGHRLICMSTNAFVSELKSRLDIYDVVSEFVTLRKAGANWVGLCPFHSEKTPSFTVNPAKQIFHCFGCSTGGDLITFIMKHEGMTFREALDLLARRCGLEAPSTDHRAAEKKDQILGLYEAAEKFYRSHLVRDRRVRSYLKERGLNEAMIEAFGLGSAPREWTALRDHLARLGHSDDLMLRAGLVAAGKNNRVYDLFRERALFPIYNLYGRTIALGGRALTANQQPKYLNSRETEIFSKSHTLYALDKAREAIKSAGFAIVTEGYLDTIACHQFGFSNTVATLGTAITEGHARLIKRFTSNSVLVFDGDSAGVRAARKAVRVLLPVGLVPRIVILPDNSDPDTFLRTRGRDEFRSLIQSAEDMVEFLLRQSLDKSKGQTGLALVGEALAILAEIPSPLMRGQAMKTLSERTGIQERFLMEELQRIQPKGGPSGLTDESQSSPKEDSRREPSEALLLASAFDTEQRVRSLLEVMRPEDFLDEKLRAIFVKLTEFLEPDHRWDASLFMRHLPEGDLRSTFTGLLANRSFDAEESQAIFDASLKSLRRRNTLASHQELIRRIGRLDREAMARFMEEQRRLKKSRPSGSG